eukprot:6380732-Prymnesium_polylepis.1
MQPEPQRHLRARRRLACGARGRPRRGPRALRAQWLRRSAGWCACRHWRTDGRAGRARAAGLSAVRCEGGQRTSEAARVRRFEVAVRTAEAALAGEHVELKGGGCKGRVLRRANARAEGNNARTV